MHVCMPSDLNAAAVGLWAARAAAVCLHWARTTTDAHSRPTITHCRPNHNRLADVLDVKLTLEQRAGFASFVSSKLKQQSRGHNGLSLGQQGCETGQCLQHCQSPRLG